MPSAEPKDPPEPPSSLRRLATNTRWALAAAWATRPSLVIGIAAVTLLRGLIPAALAVLYVLEERGPVPS